MHKRLPTKCSSDENKHIFLKKDRTIAGYTFPLVTQLRKDKTHHRCLPFVNFIQILRAINTQATFISFCHLSFAMRDSECYSVADDDKRYGAVLEAV